MIQIRYSICSVLHHPQEGKCLFEFQNKLRFTMHKTDTFYEVSEERCPLLSEEKNSCPVLFPQKRKLRHEDRRKTELSPINIYTLQYVSFPKHKENS